MKKLIISTFLVINAFLMIVSAQEFRTESLANMDLVLNHAENQLDLYRSTGNIAYMIPSERQNWISILGSGQQKTGGFKRHYDPETSQDFLFQVEGYKILSNNQAFWGRVNYRVKRLTDVPYAVEPDPYALDPVIVADTTVGRFHYDGPEVSVRYNYLPFNRLGFGAELFYSISQGIKKKYTRPRILHRDFSSKIAATLDLGKNIMIGGFFNYRNYQDQIEFVNTKIDLYSPLVIRYRSENIYWYRIGGFEHYDKFNSRQANFSIQKTNPNQTIRHLLQMNYTYQEMEIFDETSKKFQDSDWYCDIFNGQYENRFIGINKRWNLGTRIGARYLSCFSQHPNLDILITEREILKFFAEVGASYRTHVIRPAMIGLQIGFVNEQNDFNDYQSKIVRNLEENQLTGKLGIEWSLSPIHNILFGFQYGSISLNEFSPRYLPDHNLQRITVGFQEIRAGYHWALHVEYFTKVPEIGSESFKGGRVVFSTRIFPR